MMRNVHLYGFLREKYGGPHRFDVDSVVDVVRALAANFPDFIRTIKEGSYQLMRGKDIDTGDPLDESMLTFRLGREDLHIVPVAAGSSGSGKGIITAVLGVAMIGTAFLTGGASMGAAIFAKGTTGAAIFGGLTYTQLAIMGGILAVGGIYQALASTPTGSYDLEDDEKVSFLFNGAINRMEQGGALPVVFGRFRVGSITVSAGIDVEEIA